MDRASCLGRRPETGRLPVAHPGEPVFLVAEQLAELWSVSVGSVYREVHASALAAIRIGDPGKGRLLIPAQAIEPYRSTAQAVPARPYHRLGAAARFFGISYGHLLREIRADRFPAVRIRSMWLVPTPAIDVMIRTALDRGGIVLARDFGEWGHRDPDQAAQPAAASRDQPAVS
jgi:hypothetical protein